MNRCYRHRDEALWLFRHMKPFARLHVLSLLCVSTVSALALAEPLVMKWLIDCVLPARNLHLLLVATTCFCATYAIQLVLQSTATLLTFQGLQRMILNVRINLFAHLHRLAADYHDQNPLGETVFRIEQDVEQVGSLGGEMISNALRLGLMAVFCISAMLWLNLKLTVLIIPLMPVFLMAHYVYQKVLQARSEELQQLSSERSGFLQESIGAVTQTQLLGRERLQKKRFTAVAIQAFRAGSAREVSAMRFSLSTMSVVITGMTTILAVGGYQVMRGTFTVGGLVAFCGYLAGLFVPLSSAVELHSRFHRVGASIRRIVEIEETIPTVQSVPGARLLPDKMTGSICFRGVSFAYPDGTKIIDAVDLEIKPREKIAIVGPSGSGKSSIAKLIARLYDVSSGAIFLDGIDIREVDLCSYRSSVSLIPQEPVLFRGSIRQNVLLGDPAAESAEIERIAAIARLTTIIQDFPTGWERTIGNAGSGLSGGERQRVALARSLLQHRKVLILDEATSALDARTEAAFLEGLSESFPSTTILIISHREAVARWADRVVVLSNGKIVEQGTHAQLERFGKLYQGLWQPRDDTGRESPSIGYVEALMERSNTMRSTGQSANDQLIKARVRISEDIRDASNQDGAVLLDIERGHCLSLNVVGAKIWQLLKQNRSGEEIVSVLACEFSDVPRQQLEQDYADFIHQLESHQLARLAESSSKVTWSTSSTTRRKLA